MVRFQIAYIQILVQIYKQRQASPGRLSALCVLTHTHRSSRLHLVTRGVAHSLTKSLKAALDKVIGLVFLGRCREHRSPPPEGLLAPAGASLVFHLHQEPAGSCQKPNCSLLPYCSKSPQQKPFAAFSTHYWKDLQGWAKDLKDI